MRIARYPQVVRATYVDAELEVVALHQLRDVPHELELLLVLVQRAVAPVYVES